MTDSLAKPIPGDQVHILVDSVTEPFWTAARDDQLVIPRCGDCRTFRMPPTPFCPNCQSQLVTWHRSSGIGAVYSYTVVPTVYGAPGIVAVPAVVELRDERPARLVTNIVDVAPADVHIDLEVMVQFSPITDGWKVPVFRPLI